MWFKRKKKEEPIIPANPPVCHHKYIDFDWYVKEEYIPSRTDCYRVKVCEPYVCILCKHREDRELCTWAYCSYKEMDKKAQELLEDERIHDAMEIEDKIADMQMLDPYYLDAYFKLYPERKEQKQ